MNTKQRVAANLTAEQVVKATGLRLWRHTFLAIIGQGKDAGIAVAYANTALDNYLALGNYRAFSKKR
jgi:hypothetical protein